MILSRKLLAGLMTVGTMALGIAVVTTACGSDNGSTFKDPDAQGSIFSEASLGDSGDSQFIALDDPPAGYCGPDAGDAATPVTIGGTQAAPTTRIFRGAGARRRVRPHRVGPVTARTAASACARTARRPARR